jgi:hypothetical protein
LLNSKAANLGQTPGANHSEPIEEEETKDANPKHPADKADNWKEEEVDLVFNQLGLKGVIDNVHHTGVVLSKCCHYFHFECLKSYLTSEST